MNLSLGLIVEVCYLLATHMGDSQRLHAIALLAVPAPPASIHHFVARRLVAVFLVGSLVDCGSTASIVRTNGTVDEAKIVRSDSGALYVRYEGETGEPIRVRGASVSDIDHPGNVAMVVGAIFLAEVGLLMSGRGFRSELIIGPAGDTSAATIPMTLIFGLPGAALMGIGLYHYLSSKRAARLFEKTR